MEWARIEFKEGWNPDTTLKTISAFANDIDNWGGGYIVIGAKEKDGKLVRPVTGIAPDAVDRIQKDLLRYCKYLKPVYIPQSEPVYFDGKLLLLVWCPGGYERPYACPKAPDTKNSEKIYYIRKLSISLANALIVFKVVSGFQPSLNSILAHSTGICFFTVIAVYTKVFGIVESSFVVPVRKAS